MPLKFKMEPEGFEENFLLHGGIETAAHRFRVCRIRLHQQVWEDFLAETSIPTPETPDRSVRGSQPPASGEIEPGCQKCSSRCMTGSPVANEQAIAKVVFPAPPEPTTATRFMADSLPENHRLLDTRHTIALLPRSTTFVSNSTNR